MPAQPVLDPGPLADQVLAVIDEQPQLPARGRGQVGLADRGARDRQRVDRARLAPAAGRAAAPPPSASAAPAPPARRGRSESAPADTTPGGNPRARSRARRRAPGPTRAAARGPPRCPAPSARRPARPCAGRSPPRCESACVVHPDPIMCTVPSLDNRLTDGPSEDKSQSGRCHAPIKSRRRSSGGGGRQNPCQSVHSGRQATLGSAHRQPGTYRPSRTPPTRDAEPDTEGATLCSRLRRACGLRGREQGC